jgi:predicted amidohydrolase YtcJ
MAADVTVLDRDPLAAAPEELWALRATATVVDGRVVHPA